MYIFDSYLAIELRTFEGFSEDTLVFIEAALVI
jgi:hypothetical protein